MALRIIHMAYAGFDGCPGCVSRHTATKSYDLSQREAAAEEEGPWYHGTRDEYNPGDSIEHYYWKKYPDRPDFRENSPLYTTTDPSLAAHIADLRGDDQAPGRMYEVRPTGPLKPDEIANPLVKGEASWMTSHPLHVVREIPRHEWPEDLNAWRDDRPTWEREAVKGYDLSPRSGMIYLDIPPGLIRRVPGGIDDEHITLVYLGKDVDDEAFAEACRRAQQAAAQHHPMEGVLHGIETFEPSDSSDNKVPAFVPAYVPGIGKLRQALEDLSASEHRQYRPHVTLGYYQEGEELPPPHPPVHVRFDRLHVKRGDDVASFPLGGQPQLHAEASAEEDEEAESVMRALGAPAPDIGQYFKRTDRFGDDHDYAVSGWMRRRTFTPQQRAWDKEFGIERQGHGPDNVPLEFCHRHQAEYVMGSGVAGTIARLNEIHHVSPSGWSAERIERQREEARRRAGEPLF